MTYYIDLGFSSCQVAGAVAEAAIHELRVNGGLPGFPQVDVSCAPDDSFTVVMSWNKTASAQFQLSETEAESVVDTFKSRTSYDDAFLDRVRTALIDLEGKVSRYPATWSAYS